MKAAVDPGPCDLDRVGIEREGLMVTWPAAGGGEAAGADVGADAEPPGLLDPLHAGATARRATVVNAPAAFRTFWSPRMPDLRICAAPR